MTVQVFPILTKARTHRGTKYPAQDTGNVAHIERNSSIRIVGERYGKQFDRTFKIGDEVEYGSYNLIYLGKIEKITDKGVTIMPTYGSRITRLSLDEFTWRNYDLDLEAIAKRNAETSMCI